MEYRRRVIDLARGAAVEPAVSHHLESCPECARLFEEQSALHGALRNLTADVAPVDFAMEARVLAEFDRVYPRRRRLSATGWMLAAGLAASVALGVFVDFPRPAAVQGNAPQEAPFLTVPYTIPLAPEERTEVVRMKIPVTALLAAGFHVPGSDPAADVDADVLVSADGRVRAVRALSISISN